MSQAGLDLGSGVEPKEEGKGRVWPKAASGDYQPSHALKHPSIFGILW